jgi:uncharacterized protein
MISSFLIGSASALLLFAPPAKTQRPAAKRPPIIDMHLHALPADYFGKPSISMCASPKGLSFPGIDPKDPHSRVEGCPTPFKSLKSAASDEELMRGTLSVMERYNVIGVTSGPIDLVRRWRESSPDRIIPAVSSSGRVPLDSIRAWAKNGTIRVLGELSFQYAGLEFSDSVPEAHFALAEELDLPVGIHVGPGPPGAAYFFGSPRYRVRLSNPILLEETLLRHPKMRVYVMHAGWPMLDEMIALLFAHPQVYVDVGVISWKIPRAEFHTYLRRIVQAGFGGRVMFGSDQMIWPEALRLAIDGIESADFLSSAQKRDILYNNAVRFLRLSSERADAMTSVVSNK